MGLFNSQLRRWCLFALGFAAGCRGSSPGVPDSSIAASGDHPPYIGLEMQPEGFATGLGVNDAITISIPEYDKIRKEDVEAAVRISALGGEALTWKGSWSTLVTSKEAPRIAFSVMTLTPTRPLAADTDYRIDVRAAGTFKAESTGFHNVFLPTPSGEHSRYFGTGSHPRLATLYMVSKDGGKSVTYVEFYFSERVVQNSVLDKFSLVGKRGPIRGEWLIPSKEAQPTNPAIDRFHYRLSDPLDANEAVTVTFDGVVTDKGVPLEEWRANGGAKLANNRQVLALDPAKLTPRIGKSLVWMPLP